jgi:hypothetical protein
MQVHHRMVAREAVVCGNRYCSRAFDLAANVGFAESQNMGRKEHRALPAEEQQTEHGHRLGHVGERRAVANRCIHGPRSDYKPSIEIRPFHRSLIELGARLDSERAGGAFMRTKARGWNGSKLLGLTMATVVALQGPARADRRGMPVSLAIEGRDDVAQANDCAHEIGELRGILDPGAELNIEIELGERENRLRVISRTHGTIVDDARPVEASAGELCRDAMRLALAVQAGRDAVTSQKARSLRRHGELETSAGWVFMGLGAALVAVGAGIMASPVGDALRYGGGAGFLAFGGTGMILVGIPLLIAGGVHKHQARAMTIGISPTVEGGRSAGGMTRLSWRF